MPPYSLAFATLALALSTLTAVASGTHSGGHAAMTGQPGDPARADRIVEISMTEMAFRPTRIQVAEGETITFVVRNDGTVMHEFNLGTTETWQVHADEMMKMMKTGMMTAEKLDHHKMMQAGMMHHDANSVLLEPGQNGKVTWTFGEKVDLGFACNVPGHRESGLVGDVVFMGL